VDGASAGYSDREVLTAPRAPWQNAFVERVIGSIRRECLDHFLILSEAHLRRLLHAYAAYYNTTRQHQSLDNNSPQPRAIEPPPCGRIIAIPQVGGLHHRYQRAA
jgi:putative transposase